MEQSIAREARALRVAAQLEAELAHAIEIVEDLARARGPSARADAVARAMAVVTRNATAANG